MLLPTPKPLQAFGVGRPWRTLGSLHPDAVLVVVWESLLAEIVEFSERDRSREIGGFLLGGLFEHEGEYVELRHFIPAVDVRSQSASLTFTHDTWSALTRDAERLYPDDVVVGWQHTHPNMGIFLSEKDLFIHRHFFSQPWQIALVVDPVKQELGFFQWRGGEVVDCGIVVLE